MAQIINDNFQLNAPKPLDKKYSKYENGIYTPYISLNEALQAIASDYRYRGLTVFISTNEGVFEYWFKDGVQDSDLVLKFTSSNPQIQSDWEQVNDTSLDFIKNKPSIPSSQIQSDWLQSNSSSLDYIKNKPIIPAGQIQSDWNQTNNSALDFIKNKPTITSPSFYSYVALLNYSSGNINSTVIQNTFSGETFSWAVSDLTNGKFTCTLNSSYNNQKAFFSVTGKARFTGVDGATGLTIAVYGVNFNGSTIDLRVQRPSNGAALPLLLDNTFFKFEYYP